MLQAGFLTYLVLLVIRPQEFLPSMAGTPLLQLVMVMALLAWSQSRPMHLEFPQFRLMLPFLLTTFIGIGLGGWWGGIPKALDYLLPSLAIFTLASGAVRDRAQLRRTEWVIVGCACLIVLHGHLQMKSGIGWSGALPAEGRITYVGLFNDPNDLGVLFTLAIALAIHLLQEAGTRLGRITIGAALGWLAYGVMLTNSRGTLLACLAVVGYHVYGRYGARAVMVGATLALPALFAYTRLSQLDPDEESAEGRLDAWYEGLQMLREHPLFGVGYGNFTDHNLLTAHNSLVLAMAELGMVGFPLWLAFIGYSASMLQRLVANRPAADEVTRQAEWRASRAVLAAAIGVGICAFFLSQSFKPMLFLTCGLAAGRYAGVAQSLGPLPGYRVARDYPRWVGGALLCVVGLYVLVKVAL